MTKTVRCDRIILAETNFGEMSEWFKELVLKTSDPARDQGFESLSLRQLKYKVIYFAIWRITQVVKRLPC